MKPPLLDTDIVSHLLRRQPTTVDWVRQYILAQGFLQFSIITIRSDALLAANAFDSPEQDVRNEVEVLTALIYYYEQRTKHPGKFDA